MNFRFLICFTLLLSSFSSSFSQGCTASQAQIIVTIVPDNYPGETSWLLQNQAGDTLATGLANSDTLCVPTGSCLVFTIFDSYGDGLCCAYGNGSYQIKVNGTVQASGGTFGFIETKFVNCSTGQACNSPVVATVGSYTAPVANSWYRFKPDSLGSYVISTCTAPSSLNTKLWVYDNCNVPVLATDNMGTLFYNDTNSTCGNLARIHAYLDTATTYLIRVGGSNITGTIPFSITYMGPVAGCLDSNACNYDPLATVIGPCYYGGNPLCPPGPDLELVQSVFENSLVRGTVTSSNCMVAENCLTGYGQRTVIRFDTDIRNIGQTDYFIGSPATHPTQFNNNNCHNHAHYEGYAEYVLYPTVGNRIPIGFKNGFCVMDLACPAGYTAKYGCGNMGITAGCGDIYGAYLDCQWIDITDVADGDYTLATKVNWDQSPDALGRYETNYANNWAQACINIYTDSLGRKQFTKYPNCAPYLDCNGTPYGNAQLDCEGNCGGMALAGDLNRDSVRTTADYTAYMAALLPDTMSYTVCKDLSGDSVVTLWDAVLLGNCLVQGGGASCDFPRGLYNIQQQVNIKILHLDTVQRFIDIGLSNDACELTALSFQINGIRASAVMSLLPPGSPSISFFHHVNGKIMMVVQDLTNSINRASNLRPAIRVFYSATTDSLIYLKNADAAVNEVYERVNFVADSSQFAVRMTTLSVNNLHQRPTFSVFPNPSNGIFQLQGVADSEPINLRLYDALGRLVFVQESVDFRQGQHQLQIQQAKGLYHLVVKSSYGLSSQRIVLE